ncbi:hypothetical protein V8J88_07715 [Massilia sp. W12]|uniref:hypothetical protein n=1 Tax=Massilia sp. W12 TaxID=3126507 RepID=UPI0030CCF97A
MSTTLCQMTAQFVHPAAEADLMRALSCALARFLALYVRHTPKLGWDLAQIDVCLSPANQAGANAWLALPPAQRAALLKQTLAQQVFVRCHQPQLRFCSSLPANPERSIRVYLPGKQGGCEWQFEFPGDFCYLPQADAVK